MSTIPEVGVSELRGPTVGTDPPSKAGHPVACLRVSARDTQTNLLSTTPSSEVLRGLGCPPSFSGAPEKEATPWCQCGRPLLADQ